MRSERTRQELRWYSNSKTEKMGLTMASMSNGAVKCEQRNGQENHEKS
jgi:hypothetical protein